MSNKENRIQYEDEKVIIYKCGAIACPNESHFETFDKSESGKQRNLYLYCFNKIIQQLTQLQEENQKQKEEINIICDLSHYDEKINKTEKYKILEKNFNIELEKLRTVHQEKVKEITRLREALEEAQYKFEDCENELKKMTHKFVSACELSKR